MTGEDPERAERILGAVEGRAQDGSPLAKEVLRMAAEAERRDLDAEMFGIFGRTMAFDRQGKPLTYTEFCDLKYHDPTYTRVACTRIGGWTVSTIWLGWNNSLDDEPPRLFETMIFRHGRGRAGTRRGVSAGHIYRGYVTEASAVDGHVEACRMVHSGWRGETPRSIRRAEREFFQMLRDAGVSGTLLTRMGLT